MFPSLKSSLRCLKMALIVSCLTSASLVSFFNMVTLMADFGQLRGLVRRAAIVPYLTAIIVNLGFFFGALTACEVLMLPCLAFYSICLAGGLIFLAIAAEIPSWIPVASQSVGKFAALFYNLEPSQQQIIAYQISVNAYALFFLIKTLLVAMSNDDVPVLPEHSTSRSNSI
jgi:hypothetical protein